VRANTVTVLARTVDLSTVASFQTARKRVREALAQAGVASAIEALVNEVLPPVG
jgi:hypothetical protein